VWSYHKSARVCSASTLHDYRAAFDHRKGLPETFDARPKRSGGTEIEDDDVIFGMVDRLFESQFQFDPTPSAQPALEYR
jgi:hypothetical protein